MSGLREGARNIERGDGWHASDPCFISPEFAGALFEERTPGEAAKSRNAQKD